MFTTSSNVHEALRPSVAHVSNHIMLRQETASKRKQQALDDIVKKARTSQDPTILSAHKTEQVAEAASKANRIMMHQEWAAKLHQCHVDHTAAVARHTQRGCEEKVAELRDWQREESDRLMKTIQADLQAHDCRHEEFVGNIQEATHKHNAYAQELFQRMKVAEALHIAAVKEENDEKMSAAAQRAQAATARVQQKARQSNLKAKELSQRMQMADVLHVASMKDEQDQKMTQSKMLHDAHLASVKAAAHQENVHAQEVSQRMQVAEVLHRAALKEEQDAKMENAQLRRTLATH
jgi:hypothetical protein